MMRYIKLFEDFDLKDSNLSYDELFIKLAWLKYYGEGTREELTSIPELEDLLKSLPKPTIESISEDARTEWGGVKLGESVSAEELPRIYERMGHYADDSVTKFRGHYELNYIPVNPKITKYRLSDDYEDLEHFDRVNEYADAIRGGEELPPVIYTDGYFSDGAHRMAAHVDLGRNNILAFSSRQKVNQEDKGDLLEKKLLSLGGDKVKLGLDSDEELDRMLNDGLLFDEDVINLKGGFGQCHRNVADKYKRFRNSGFKIVSGYALNDGVWLQHSWGLGSTGKIMETTSNHYDKYYGYVLNKDESDEFCFSNY